MMIKMLGLAWTLVASAWLGAAATAADTVNNVEPVLGSVTDVNLYGQSLGNILLFRTIPERVN